MSLTSVCRPQCFRRLTKCRRRRILTAAAACLLILWALMLGTQNTDLNTTPKQTLKMFSTFYARSTNTPSSDATEIIIDDESVGPVNVSYPNTTTGTKLDGAPGTSESGSRYRASIVVDFLINCQGRCQHNRTKWSRNGTSASRSAASGDGSETDERDVFLLIVVHSSTRNFDRRQRIRNMWANEQILTTRPEWSTKPPVRIETVFFTGEPTVATYVDEKNFENNATDDLGAKENRTSSFASNGNDTVSIADDHVMSPTSHGDRRTPSEIQKLLNIEAGTHGDIVQGNFMDSYRNLTYKAMSVLQWIVQYCNSTRYVLKTDDDAFVNIFIVVRHLLDLERRVRGGTEVTVPPSRSFFGRIFNRLVDLVAPTVRPYSFGDELVDEMDKVSDKSGGFGPDGVIMCLLYANASVSRTGKWAVSIAEMKEKIYPPYCSGVAYIMSGGVPAALLRASADVPPFWIDDVYVTGMLVKQTNWTVRHADMSSAYCKYDKMVKLYGDPVEWYKYAFSHVGVLRLNTDELYANQLHTKAWTRLLQAAASTFDAPLPKVAMAGRLSDKETPREKIERIVAAFQRSPLGQRLMMRSGTFFGPGTRRRLAMGRNGPAIVIDIPLDMQARLLNDAQSWQLSYDGTSF